MREFVLNNFQHVLCGLLLSSRLADIITTRLVTPSMKLEANLLMKRLGWKFALSSLLLCFVPYISAPAGVMMLVAFLLVSANNAHRIWLARALGEDEYLEILKKAARRTKRWVPIVCTMVAALLIGLLGGFVLLFYPDPAMDWGYWIGMGMIAFGVAISVHGILSSLRIFKLAKEDKERKPGDRPVTN